MLSVVARREDEESLSYMLVILNITGMLVLLQVPKCFVQVQIFCAKPKMYLHIVAVTNILCQTKR